MSERQDPPELRLVADPPAAFFELAGAALARRAGRGPLRFACSGGSAGRACMERLVAGGLPFGEVDLYFVDERCVPSDSPDSNARSLSEALGERLSQLAGYHPMDCSAGPAAYEADLRAAGGLDLVQLGMGPDGHTASLFPGSPGLEAPADRLVIFNEDPSGRNPHRRLSLTFAAIAQAELAVVTAFGAEKHEPLQRIFAGERLPAAQLSARRLVWLVDQAAAGDLPTTSSLPEELTSPRPTGGR